MTDPTPEPKLRARQQVLHYVLSFCITRQYQDAEAPKGVRRYPGSTGFFIEGGPEGKAQAGDLVILSSAPATKWTIGWLHEPDETTNPGWPRYLIESLDDGELCWWQNVGLYLFPRDEIQPQWRWTDAQHAFADLWSEVCYKDRDAYVIRPVQPTFGDGHAVTLGTRTSHGFDDIRPTRTFADWRAITRDQMGECYDSCVAERERVREKRKAAESTGI